MIEDIHKVLNMIYWPETLNTQTFYTRVHDDHEGKFDEHVSVVIDPLGDVYLLVNQEPPLRFRTFGGGGMSLRVRNALLVLAEAIRLDNIDKPQR